MHVYKESTGVFRAKAVHKWHSFLKYNFNSGKEIEYGWLIILLRLGCSLACKFVHNAVNLPYSIREALYENLMQDI